VESLERLWRPPVPLAEQLHQRGNEQRTHDGRVDQHGERGPEPWSYLDMTALGRQEEWEDSPEGYPQTPHYGWWNYHDAYGAA
jgi:predicted dithiol-disulfide oxidoreductase (DUF899 family)